MIGNVLMRMRVRVALWRALGVHAGGVRVRCDAGTIRLEGVLHTGWEAEMAARAARGVREVVTVENRIATSEGTGTAHLGCRIGPDGMPHWLTLPGHYAAQASPGLADAVLYHLYRDPLLISDAIETVEEEPGVIALLGTVPTRFHFDLADLITRRHAGVRAVRNDLRIVYQQIDDGFDSGNPAFFR